MLSQLKQEPRGDSIPATKLYDKHRCCRQTIPENLLQNISIWYQDLLFWIIVSPRADPK